MLTIFIIYRARLRAETTVQRWNPGLKDLGLFCLVLQVEEEGVGRIKERGGERLHCKHIVLSIPQISGQGCQVAVAMVTSH